MGNEESQQGGAAAPGQPQQGTPFGMGGGPPQPRFGGPTQQAPGMRQVAPTGRPILRPGGPGPPQPVMGGAFPGGGPRQQSQPVRPVQVGVQPWAEPPVQQPARFRGSVPQTPVPQARAPQQVTPLRPLTQVQQQQQQLQQQQQAKQQQQQLMMDENLGLDLSDLSEAEKEKILSVMARAQDLDEDYERHKRAKDETDICPQLLCPLCQLVDLATETNKMCGDCGKNFCQKCGTFVPGEGRRSVWVCNTCSNRRKQQSAAMAAGHQDTTTYTMAGQKVAGDPNRKDETMSREYLHPGSVDDVVSLPTETGPNEYYLLMEDDDDDWGRSVLSGEDSSPGIANANDDGFSDRTSSIRLMLEEEDDDEEDAYDSDEDNRGGGGSSTLPYYDRSPGEVYTIPEEEEDLTSPMSHGTWDGDLNPDTASSLLRWRGMGQPFQPQQQQQPMTTLTTGQQSVSLLGTSSSGGGFVSGSLIPSSAVSGGMGRGSGTIPRTVPLTALSQTLQQQQQPMWPNSQPQQQGQPLQSQPQNQWNLQQAQVQQQVNQVGPQQLSMQMNSQKSKPMDLVPGMMMTTQQQQQMQIQQQQQQQQQKQQQQQQQLKGQKGQKVGEQQDWSPGTDLSPIMDVSPSLEAAEQELMEKCQEADQLRPIPRATSGTISGMLADFNKALGLATTPTLDDGQQRSLVATTTTTAPQQQMSGIVGSGGMAPTSIIPNGTEMDQNQNLVQQQFQLQQQQLMIQQQQQVIAQQQQQLQQQAHLQQQMQQQQQQQLQSHQQLQSQQQQQQVLLHDMQQQQQQQHVMQQTSLVQHQPGVVIGGAPMQQQQQSQSQRKVHRRLPQPTMEQMHAAVAIAAQTPKSKSQAPRTTPSIGTATPSFQRPISPMMAPGSARISSSQASSIYDTSSSGGLLSVQQPGMVGGISPSALNTSISPTPRKDQESMDMEAGKKIRRRLPPVPLDQEPTSVPLRRTKDRTRTLSMGAMPLSTSSERSWDRRIPQRTTSLDDGMSLTKALNTTTSSDLDFLGLSSSTDTYLKFLTSTDYGGLLGSSLTTTTSSVLASIPSSIGLSTTTMLGRRDLSAPHSLSSYLRSSGVGVVPSTSASYLLDHATTDTGPKLPSYLMSLKQQLREELRSVTDQRRRITDPDLSGLLSQSSWPETSTYDPIRKLGSTTLPLTSGGGRLGGPQARRNRHRRHASDTKLSMFSSLGRDDFMDDPLSRYKFYQPSSSMPFKSFEFESIDDHLRTDGLYSSSPYTRSSALFRGSSTYPRRSSLTDMTADRIHLRDTSVNSLGLSKTRDSPAMRKYSRDLARLRRHTDTGLMSFGMGLDPYGRTTGGYSMAQRHHHLRKPRSWHPSPYVSEDEDEREEKKAKIKAEIARRRQHIEENARLHDELYKIARVRDATGYVSPAYGDRLYTSPISLESGGSSQESTRDQDALQAMDVYRSHPYSSSSAYVSPHHSRSLSSRYDGVSRSHSQPWQYEYGYLEDDPLDPLNDPFYDYSPPVTDSEADLAPMPLLPDMPTRSRKLLQDLGSTPLHHQPYSDPPSKQHYSRSGGVPYDDDYVDSREPLDDVRRHAPHSQSSGDRHQSTYLRKAQNSKTSQKYDFPVKRILLTRDPKDRSVSGNGLGMKVVGGKEIPGSNGMIGAYVARIYPGGVVETLGEVREGDQVLEWNCVPLTGKTYEEVQRIIASSGDEVEIVIRSDFNMLSSRSSSHHHHHHHQQPQNQSRLSRSSGHSDQQSGHSRSNNQSYHQSGSYRTSRGDTDGYNRNYDSADYHLHSMADEGVHNSNYLESERSGSASPSRGYRQSSNRQQRIGSPTGKGDTTENKEKYRAENISGEIQLQVCHDSKAKILYVTIVRARNLVTSRDNSGLPDPYVKCYLLPERCFENQRRTRYFSRCSNPEWKQTMVYPEVSLEQLKKKHLEISVWNYDINRPPEFLGEVIIDLKDSSVIDEQSRWYKLHPHDPKKYPCLSSSLNNEGSMKMARLNNPAQKTLYFENGGDDIRKSNNLEKRFFKQLTKKSNINENYARASEQSKLATSSTSHGQHYRSSSTSTGLSWRCLFHPMTAKQSVASPVIQVEFLRSARSPVLAISA
ncbi:uncharacterized protein [Parasteatoda tepidariorum]|uniref:uncharacterized protein isoform X2 n=1 Tax=Parasteatoda tepidariorum TaxID=114398 RepID=UPI001C7233AF|nr:uncharacterized protein LOC107436973 isoform X2 [Parasteatoda tepidariorum]